MTFRRGEAQLDPDARAYQRSVAAIGWQVALGCTALVVAVGLLAVAYVFWQSEPTEQVESHARGSVRVFLDLPELILAGVVVGALAVACTWVAARHIARRAVRPLNEAFRLQRRFTADASHELRNPLAVLSARAQQLATLIPVTDSRRPVVEALREDIRLMSGIVDDLLETASGAPPSAGTAPLTTTLTETVDSMRVLASQYQVSLVERPIEADVAMPGRALRRCLATLVDNAVDYSPPGGTVTVASEVRDATVRVTVADEGHGITGIDPDRVFDRFAHGTAPTTDHAGLRARHGIGLSLVRELAERYGGSVRVAATGATGTVFELTLPLAEDAGAHDPRRKPVGATR